LALEVELRLDFVATNEAELFTATPRLRVSPPQLITIPPAHSGYRRIAEITTAETWIGDQRMARSLWRVPEAVENLIILTRIKLAAARKEITGSNARGQIELTRRGDFILVAGNSSFSYSGNRKATAGNSRLLGKL